MQRVRFILEVQLDLVDLMTCSHWSTLRFGNGCNGCQWDRTQIGDEIGWEPIPQIQYLLGIRLESPSVWMSQKYWFYFYFLPDTRECKSITCSNIWIYDSIFLVGFKKSAWKILPRVYRQVSGFAQTNVFEGTVNRLSTSDYRELHSSLILIRTLDLFLTFQS